jgi:hypothetical protein
MRGGRRPTPCGETASPQWGVVVDLSLHNLAVSRAAAMASRLPSSTRGVRLA